jgi:Secretion system C-terminal sorting domain
MKTITIMIVTIISILFTDFSNSQDNRYLMNSKGEFIPLSKLKNYTPPKHRDNLKRNIFGDVLFDPNYVQDTISYRQYFAPTNFNFGYFGQDRMVQWFVAPADMIIISAGVMCVAKDNADTQVELKLVKFAWTLDEISAIETATNLGYYEATGNGYNDITAYLDDPDRTGDWVDVTGNGLTSPFGSDVWSDSGVGYQFTPVVDINAENYNWVQMNNFFEPEVLLNDIIGVSVKNSHHIMDEERVGWYAAQSTGLPLAFKFYANGRLEPGVDIGWWARDFTWDFALVVELVSTPLSPVIVGYTKLGTTLSTEPRLVEAEVRGDPAVDQVWLVYSTNGGVSWTEIEMDGTEPFYSAYIPGMPPGTEVTYIIKATDVNGNTATSLPVVYNIFMAENPNLVVFNGYDNESGYPQEYYFGPDISGGSSEFPHDVWAFGPLTTELVDNYTNIFEFTTTGPEDYNDSVITNWLSADGSRNYFLAGQEWFGLKNGFIDSTYVPGSFEYDILGITHSYNDVSYDGTSGQELPTLVFPQLGTMFGGPLFDLFNANPTDSMQYNPGFEIGVTNWIDAFDVISGQEVDMKLETRGIAGVPAVETLACGTHRELNNGNKIVFLAYDPLSLNSSPDYTWYGYTNENTPYQALQWFGITVSVEQEDDLIPEEFSLSQNYPNPFNPTTTIKFTIPSVGTQRAMSVQLKVYDILGNEITTLVNEEKSPGIYEVEFDAAGLPSGIYFYQLHAGSFVQTKKMILLK